MTVRESERPVGYGGLITGDRAASVPHAAATHRRDIDGLRAIAVSLVILYHFGFTSIPGGFVGVDVFFVISGYLITSIIWREMQAGSFSLVAFWERRVRRILPAAMVMIAATVGASYWLVPSTQFESVAWSGVASAFYYANIQFWTEAGYFGTASELKPLLHTWSLSVEEQFYIAFPLALLILRKARVPIVAALAALAVLSFGWQAYSLAAAPSDAAPFYLAHNRAWELLIGSVLAVTSVRLKLPQVLAALAAALGLGLIVASALMLDAESAFPGFAALAPTMGAALIILAGLNDNILSRQIGNPLFSYLGRISYSLYLWHWPVIVLAGYWFFPDEPGIGARLTLLALILALSHLSWRYIENPIRERRVFPGRAVFAASAAGMAGLAIVCSAVIVEHGFPQRLSPEASALLETAQRSPQRRDCHGGYKRELTIDEYCAFGAAGVQPTIALWGDSHGAELASAIGALLAEDGRSLKSFTYSQCPPALNFATRSTPACRGQNVAVLQYLTDHPEIQHVILVAYYRYYYKRGLRREFEKGLAATVKALTAAGKSVTVVHQIPYAEHDIPMMIGSLLVRGADPDSVNIDRRRFDKETKKIEAFLTERLPKSGQITHARPADVLCGGDGCLLQTGNAILYSDEHHLSMAGAAFVAKGLAGALIGQ